MPKQWNRVSEKLLPPKGRVVLLNIAPTDNLPACIVAGYMKRYSEGEFYFVTPGADVQRDLTKSKYPDDNRREVMYWSDCLGDDFQCPLWDNKTMNKQ